MSNLSMHKISYLEGVRGFAALQVVLVHYFLAFLPAHQCSRFWFCWAQALREVYLFFPIDGYMAVSLFFILSGYVLTKSFARTRDQVAQNIFKRWVRLQIPVFFSLLIALVLLLLCGDAFLRAAELNDTVNWAQDFFVVPPTLGSFLKESFWVSLIAGYQGISVFGGLGGPFFSGQESLDVPLWSLNIEFWGSILIIGLAWLRPKTTAHQMVLILCLGIFCMNSLVLFLVGHILACLEDEKFPRTLSLRRNANWIGLLLVVLGILISTWREDLMPPNIFVLLDSIVFFQAQSPFHYIGMVAAIFIFIGIYISPWLHRFFELGVWQKLGKISFAIYLLHFPILLTITAWLQVQLDGFLGHLAGAVTAFILGLVLTFALATFFTKWLDEPAIRFSRFICNMKLSRR